MQVMESYEARVKLFENLHESQQCDRLRSIAQNGVDLGNRKKIKCDRAFIWAYSRAYCACHMKWTHCIDKVAKKFGHSSPFMLFRLMLMLDNLQEVKNNADIKIWPL